MFVARGFVRGTNEGAPDVLPSGGLKAEARARCRGLVCSWGRCSLFVGSLLESPGLGNSGEAFLALVMSVAR